MFFLLFDKLNVLNAKGVLNFYLRKGAIRQSYPIVIIGFKEWFIPENIINVALRREVK